MKKPVPGFSVWQDPTAACTAAAHFFVMACRRYIAEKGRFAVALSGGNTPRELFRLLATEEFSQNIQWKNVYFFWSDERFVPATDPDSNYRMAKETLLDAISIPKKNIFRVPTKGKPEACAANYENQIRDFFKGQAPAFDWILLGTGMDGHTASLFPGTSIVTEKKKLIKETWVEAKQTWRISFTFPLINKAAAIILLVTGSEKAKVISSVIKNKKPVMPVQLVSPSKGLTYWIVDRAAYSGSE